MAAATSASTFPASITLSRLARGRDSSVAESAAVVISGSKPSTSSKYLRSEPGGQLGDEEIRRAVAQALDGVLERVDEPLHGGRRRVHLVRDAGDEHAEAGHLLGVDELALGRAELAQRALDLGLGVLQLGRPLAHAALEHLGERAHLGVEARVLDGGRRLVGEGHEQAQVGLAEGRLARPPHDDDAHHALLERERRRDDGAREAGGARALHELGIGLDGGRAARAPERGDGAREARERVTDVGASHGAHGEAPTSWTPVRRRAGRWRRCRPTGR